MVHYCRISSQLSVGSSSEKGRSSSSWRETSAVIQKQSIMSLLSYFVFLLVFMWRIWWIWRVIIGGRSRFRECGGHWRASNEDVWYSQRLELWTGFMCVKAWFRIWLAFCCYLDSVSSLFSFGYTGIMVIWLSLLASLNFLYRAILVRKSLVAASVSAFMIGDRVGQRLVGGLGPFLQN